MRNLKRALSLTLASVMLLGMMVIGTSAASYPDVTDEHNVEAIEVLQAVGVMSGSDSGNFNPDSQVSRIEMAIVMSNLLNLKVDYFEGQCKFTDVPAWAGKYVAACEAEGIVSGVGGGRFGTGNVTATQAALMMLKALGYFQYASDFEGGWDRNTARLAANLLLFKGIDDVQNDTVLTRNQVAQLALNTLKTPVVIPEDNTLHITGGAGDTAINITGGSVKYVVTASSQPYAQAIDDERADQDTLTGIGGYVIELGEKLYNGELKLQKDAQDVFGRPARYWEYHGDRMGTYVKTELIKAEYTEKVTGKMLYDLLGRDMVDGLQNKKAGNPFYDYNFNVYVDGENAYNDKSYNDNPSFKVEEIADYINRTNTDAVGGSGKGVLTQVFVNSQRGEEDVTITFINTYLAKADKDYDAKKDEVDLKVYKIDDENATGHYVKTGYNSTDKKFYSEVIKAHGSDFDVEEVKKDEFFLVTVADGEIQTMTTPEIVSEVTLNSFKRDDWVKNDDVQYDYASTAQYDEEVLDIYDNINMKDVTYNVILDQYGYLVGIELNEAAAQYVFLTGLDLGNSNLSKKNAEANVIFTDGTMKTVTVNIDKSELAGAPYSGAGYTVTGNGNALNRLPSGEFAQANTWCTYSVDGDGIYTLKQVGDYSLARDDKNANAGTANRTAKKIAQSYMDANSGKFDINGKNRSLDGSKAVINTSKGDFTKVYGNSETIYIAAKLTETTVTDKNNRQRLIVDKVDSVTTGVDNVDFTVTDIAQTNLDGSATGAPAEEAYILYNSDGYIIAAVILNAEDNGTSAKYAYVTSDVKQEDYLGNNTWRWGVDAIIDGEIVRLTEVNDSQEYIKDGMAGKWYDVRFDKDGNVSSIKPTADIYAKPTPSEVRFDYSTTDKYITNVHNVARATNGIHGDGKAGTLVTDDAGNFHGQKFEDYNEKLSSLLLFQDFTCANHTAAATGGRGTAKLSYSNFTLYTDTNATAGLGLSPSTKIVVCLSEYHNKGAFDTVTAEFTGDQGMKDALKLLDSDEKVFDGYLGAVIKDGIATSIILDDRAGDKKSTGTNTSPTEGTKVTMNVTNNDGTVTNIDGVAAYDAGMKALSSTAVRNGRQFADVVTGTTITVDLPVLASPTTTKYVVKTATGVDGGVAGVTVTGRTLTFKLTGAAAIDVAVESSTSEEEDTDSKTLTLSGTVLTANTVEVMFSTDGTSWKIAPDTTVPDPTGAKKTYKIPENASVVINSGSATTWTAGVMTQDGLTVDVTNTQLTFKMTKDGTLSGTPAGTLVRFTAAPGVTLTWTDNGGTTAKTPASETLADGSTVYLVTGGGSGDKWTANVDVINVSNAETKAGTIISAGTATVANTTLYVAPAKALALKANATASYMKGATDTSVTDGQGVVPGTLLKVGVSTQTGVTIGAVGDNMVTGAAYSYSMPSAATTLTGGYIVTLESGLTATVNGEAVASGKVVTNTTNDLIVNVPAGSGMTVVKGTGAVQLAADEYTAAPVSSDLSLKAAYEVKLGADKGVKVAYRSQPSNIERIVVTGTEGTAVTSIYVLPNTVVEFTGTDQLVVTDAGSPAAPVNLATYDKDGFNAATDYDSATYWVKLTVTENVAGWTIDGKS